MRMSEYETTNQRQFVVSIFSFYAMTCFSCVILI